MFSRPKLEAACHRWHPRAWTFDAKVSTCLVIALAVDVTIGTTWALPVSRGGWLVVVLGLESQAGCIATGFLAIFLAGTLILNDVIDDFSGALFLRIMLSIGSVQYTTLGVVAGWVLSLYCGILIVVEMMQIVLLDNEIPLSSSQVLALALGLLVLEFTMKGIIAGWPRDDWTFLITTSLLIASGALISRHRKFPAGILVLLAAILNNYILPWGVKGFGTGDLLLLVLGVFLIHANAPRK